MSRQPTATDRDASRRLRDCSCCACFIGATIGYALYWGFISPYITRPYLFPLIDRILP